MDEQQMRIQVAIDLSEDRIATAYLKPQAIYIARLAEEFVEQRHVHQD
jgi:hypothetical protein